MTNEINHQALEIAFRELWLNTPQARVLTKIEEPKTEVTIISSPPKYRPGPTQGDRKYIVSTQQHSNYYVYVLELSNKEALKIGYSHEPKKREQAYNLCMAEEVTGLRWKLNFTHKLGTAEAAQNLEQKVLSEFARYQLLSNGEILKGVSSDEARRAIISLCKKRGPYQQEELF